MKGLSVEDARARMLEGSGSPGVERVALAAAVGRVLAEPVTARRDQPPFDASAMDGWAVRRADAADAEARLRIVGESAAGRGYPAPLGPGEAVRIFTGAPVPAGADAVCIQEEASREGEVVRLGPLSDRSNVRPRGGDFRAGDRLLGAGERLDPWKLSLAAAAGAAELTVAARPRLAILSTGDEIVAPGAAPGDWQIFNSAGPALAALAREWGAAVAEVGAAGDDEAAIAQAVEAAPAELIVTIGGASVGDHDLVKPALARLGLELRVLSVNVRPGKPTWFGTLADGRRVLGLPGNPASAFVCAELFLRPLLAALQGAPSAPPMFGVRLAAALPPTGPREHWMRGRIEPGLDGLPSARAFSDQESSLVSVFAQADILIRRPAGAPIAEAGTVVEALRLERL